MNSIFEENGGTYLKCGDYLIPDIGIPEEDRQPIGKYGLLRMAYLQEYRPGLYTRMLLAGKLMTHLQEVDRTAHERMECMIPQMAKQEGVTERMKASDQMEWVRRMNSIRNRVEETILTELIYD